jgi:hypothetical protein
VFLVTHRKLSANFTIKVIVHMAFPLLEFTEVQVLVIPDNSVVHHPNTAQSVGFKEG